MKSLLLVIVALVAAGLFAAFGVATVVVLAVAAISGVELLELASRRRLVTPNALFTLGWTVPFGLAQIPVRSFYLDALPVSQSAELTGIIVIGVFYLAGSFAQLMTRRPTALRLGQSNIHVSTLVIVVFMVVSNVGYLVALRANQFQFPLLASHVSEAARTFFDPLGSATLFKFGEIGLVLAVLRLGALVGVQGRWKTRLALVAVTLVYLAEELLYGKRMGFLLSVLLASILVSTFSHLRIRRYHVALSVLVVVGVVLGNAYVRSLYGYREFWQGHSFNTVSSPLEFTLLQPPLYVHGAFAALGRVIDDPARSPSWGRYTFGPDVRSAFSQPANAYESLRHRGKMVTFLGAPVSDFGLPASVVAAGVFFFFFWVLFVLARTPAAATVYALLGSRVAVLWTGNAMISLQFAIVLVVTLLAFPTMRSLSALSGEGPQSAASRPSRPTSLER